MKQNTFSVNAIKTKLSGLSVRFIRFGPRNGCIFCGIRSQNIFPLIIDLSSLRANNTAEGEKADEAKCPFCQSDAHERLVYLFLKERTSIFTDPMRVLHFAPERMLQKKLKENNNLTYVSVDLNSRAALDEISIDDQYDPFDVIICNHVLERVLDDRKTMDEFFNALKPGGWAILQVPIAAVLNKTVEKSSDDARGKPEQLAGQYDNIRIYGRDYVSRLQEAGFTVKCYNCLDEFGQERVDEHKLSAKENIYFCLKPQWRNKVRHEEK